MATLSNSVKIDGPFALPESVTIYQIGDLHKNLLRLPILQQQILDFSDTKEVDSTGIQLLIAFDVHCKRSGCVLAFENVSNEINQLFTLFHYQFHIIPITSKAE